MRSIWKGSINFGLVAIPAKLYSGTDDRRVSFHQIHSTCGTRIQMPKWCPKCGKVEAGELRKGYEVGKDQHVILEEQDFASLPLKSLKQIEVLEFVSTEPDPRAHSDSYLLSCEDTGAKAFTLFLRAMEKAGVVGIAKLTYRDREHLCIIRPYQGIMLLQTLHYADEIRDCTELRPREVTVGDKEAELALMLIERMRGELVLSRYHDDYREALERLVEAKINGQPVAATPNSPAPTGDVVDSLLASLGMVGVRA